MGKGPYADMIRSELERCGYDILIQDDSQDNGYCLDLVEATGERTFITAQGIEGAFQKKWLDSIRRNPDVMYWLIQVEEQPAGVINLTGLENPEGRVGWAYYVGEKRLRSMGTALSLEMGLYDHALVSLGKKAVYSDVFSLNKGVIQLHRLCGCETVEEKKAHVCKEGIWYDVTYMRMTAERWLAVRDGKKYEKIAFPDVSGIFT